LKHSESVTIARLDDFDEIIDVRSPSEFALDRVPGAHSFPVLDDVERARVGTLYVQVSPFDARKLGAVLVARNIASHIESSFASRPREWHPLVYCWRGGQRSGAMAKILRDVGWRVATLEGGYQAYRREILAQLEVLPARLEFHVLCGATGSAKSRILEALAREGEQILDLEALARHRGSVLGGIPGEPQPSQKWFDSQIWDALRRMNPARPVWVEAESRKIGVLQVPTTLLIRIRASTCVRIDPPLDERVRFLIDDYEHMLRDTDWLKRRLEKLTELQSKEVIQRWYALIDSGRWEELVGDLLRNHYDPLYQKSMSRSYPTLDSAPVVRPGSLDAKGVKAAARELMLIGGSKFPA